MHPNAKITVVVAAALLLGLQLVSPPGAAALDVGARLPEIGLVDLDGNRVDAKSLEGKVVIIDFWATWCAPCREELPVLEKLYRKYKKKGLVIVGVSVDKDRANVQRFLEKLKLSFPIVHDSDHLVSGRYKPPRMPSSYVIDRKGIVRHVHEGYRASDAKSFEKQVKALLK